LYALFEDQYDLQNYIQTIPFADRAFFEIILAEFPQKPHFDIDISVTPTLQDHLDVSYGQIEDSLTRFSLDLLSNVLKAIQTVLAEVGVEIDPYTDILVYSSHGKNAAGRREKSSFHIVIDHFAHYNNQDAKGFFQRVADRVDPLYLPYLDRAVYNPRQQFRLVGCQKVGSNRPKLLEPEFYIDGTRYVHVYTNRQGYIIDLDEEEEKVYLLDEKFKVIQEFSGQKYVQYQQKRLIDQLSESLVGFTSNCKLLPLFISEETRKKYENVTLPEDVLEKAFDLLTDKLAVFDRDNPFTIRDIAGSLINLDSTEPYTCLICNRRHESENPYLSVFQNQVYYRCRRYEEEEKKNGLMPNPYFLGSLTVFPIDLNGDDLSSGLEDDDYELETYLREVRREKMREKKFFSKHVEPPDQSPQDVLQTMKKDSVTRNRKKKDEPIRLMEIISNPPKEPIEKKRKATKSS